MREGSKMFCVTKHYNFYEARNAQEEFCVKNNLPIFAPFNGICPHCCFGIYSPVKLHNGDLRGVSVEEAGSRLITGCPHCSASFCE